MEARLLQTAAAVIVACACLGANHRTDNFTCNAPTREIAVQVCEQAERFRRDLALDWLGYELPRWGKPCPITVQVGPRMGAGGATSFVFDRGEVFGWQMSIQGTLERVLDSVLPHEVTHAVFASHFRQPLPRWADEGACTTVEHASERTKQQKMLIEFLHTGRGISFAQMFAMKEYPQDVLPLYAQGHSLASYLIDQGGKRKFMTFLADGMQTEDWARTIGDHYGVANLGALQNQWLDWVAQGSPRRNPATPDADAKPVQIAATTTPAQPSASAAKTDWTSTTAAKRSRPQPNLIHTDAMIATPTPAANSSTTVEPARPNVIGAGPLVPVRVTPTPTAASPRDPFASQAGPIVQGHVSRPQPPETPRQTILEWTKTPEQAVAAPMYDASNGAGTIRR
jgi:hypothetical protein